MQAKKQYEREEKRNELKRQRGEDTWMLPEINLRLQQLDEVRYNFVLYSNKHRSSLTVKIKLTCREIKLID